MTDPAYAAALDEADPLATYRERFIGTDSSMVYFDGNSLGRPLRETPARLAAFVEQEWGGRLIRGWDESWLELPTRLGDAIGRYALGAAPGQTFVGDSTTVLLYKLARAAVAARPDRTEIVIDTDNFPTDRYLVDGIAAERGIRVRWIEVDRAAGVTPDQVAEVVGPQTALVLLSQIAYRSGFLADVEPITQIAHDAGALVLWDLCHSAGSVPIELDDWGVDLAVGCSYKYLNGGPGAPAYGYVRAELIEQLTQPIQGWMGAADVFAMGPDYHPAPSVRRFLSGTPPIIGMLALRDMVELIETAGIEAIRAKSVALTTYAIELADAWLGPLGVTLSSPRDAARRGGHLTLTHPAMRAVATALWAADVIPDYRDPGGLRIGLSPLSTSFAEVHRGLVAVRDTMVDSRGSSTGGSGHSAG